MLDHEARELFAFAGTPIFENERRKIPLLIDSYSLTRFARFAWTAAALITPVVWLLSAVVGGNETSDRLAVIVVCAAIAAMFAVDFYSAFTVTYGLHNQINSEQWDLIRTSGLRERNILRAQYDIARLRAWRPMCIDTAFRIAVTELIILNSLRYLFGPSSVIGLVITLPALLVLILCGVGLAVYVLEPLWRMKALAALSLAVASSVKNTPFAYMSLFGLTSLIHVLQIGCLVVAAYLVVSPADRKSVV